MRKDKSIREFVKELQEIGFDKRKLSRVTEEEMNIFINSINVNELMIDHNQCQKLLERVKLELETRPQWIQGYYFHNLNIKKDFNKLIEKERGI